jgi:alkanesulfonate monooxygenase SsuD/methylene tetrahydromethanopterin reductase-like flavin-dependent oxidoreductase (luciferase family)
MLGTAIVPAFTRGPAVTAMSAAALADAAAGRFVLGVGASSPAIVEQWNDIPFEQPFQRVKDLVCFLREAQAGRKITQEYASFRISNVFSFSEIPEAIDAMAHARTIGKSVVRVAD